MATFKEQFVQITQKYYKLPMARQALLLMVFAASIAFCFGVLFWFQEPSYAPLYSNLPITETSQVVSALETKGVTYKIEDRSGIILVPASEATKLRIQLAADGIPAKPQAGFTQLEKDQSFGTSRFMENLRYRHALEYELGQTIAEIKGVQSARVHLAIPKDSSFIIDGKKPSASVMVRLSPGYRLSEEQVAAIIQMVATSITGLDAKQVTVADQYGDLLSKKTDERMQRTKEDLQYEKTLENTYENNIMALLTPLLGTNKVRVKVNVDLDFTQKQQAVEKFLPSQKNVLSQEDLIIRNGVPTAQGVPGTMAIQNALIDPNNYYKNKAIKNFQVGKEVSYTQFGAYKINYITAAVIIDDEEQLDVQTGKVRQVPLSKEKMVQIEEIVKNAIGYLKSRGDKVSVINSPFAPVSTEKPLSPPGFWEEPWFWDFVKKALAVLVLLAAAILLLRPVLRNLSTTERKKKDPVFAGLVDTTEESEEEIPAPLRGGRGAQAGETKTEKRKKPIEVSDIPHLQRNEVQALNEKGWDKLKELSNENPAKVATLLSDWLGKE